MKNFLKNKGIMENIFFTKPLGAGHDRRRRWKI